MSDKPAVVIDSGVFVQAALQPTGPAARLISLLDQNLYILFVSEELLAEIEDVLQRPRIRNKNPHLTDELLTAILDRIRN